MQKQCDHRKKGSNNIKPIDELEVNIQQKIIKEGFIVDYETSNEDSGEMSIDTPPEKSMISDFVKRTLSPRRDDPAYLPPFEGKGKNSAQ